MRSPTSMNIGPWIIRRLDNVLISEMLVHHATAGEKKEKCLPFPMPECFWARFRPFVRFLRYSCDRNFAETFQPWLMILPRTHLKQGAYTVCWMNV